MKGIYILLLLMMFSSCTAYRHRYHVKDTEFERERLTELAPKDKVSIKLKTGHSFVGRVVSVADDFVVVHVRKNGNQTIYFQQISKVKYQVNGVVTGLKIVGSVVLAALALLLLFPPDVGGPLLII